MDAEFQELYQEIILDHNRSPRNFREMEDATHILDGRNPLCGDHYKLFIKIEDNKIKDISFSGSGCAISKASASVMTAVLKGKSVQEAKNLFEIFHKVVTGKEDEKKLFEEAGKLAAFAGVAEFPVRVKCATLAWHTMKKALQGEKNEAFTEE